MRKQMATMIAAALLSVWGSLTVWAQPMVTVSPEDVVRTEEVKMKLYEGVEAKTVPVTVVEPDASIALGEHNVYVAVEDDRHAYMISEFASVDAGCLEDVFYGLQEKLGSDSENCDLISTSPDLQPEDCIFIFFDENCKTEYYRISK